MGKRGASVIDTCTLFLFIQFNSLGHLGAPGASAEKDPWRLLIVTRLTIYGRKIGTLRHVTFRSYPAERAEFAFAVFDQARKHYPEYKLRIVAMPENFLLEGL